jgi:hypothetical protein
MVINTLAAAAGTPADPQVFMFPPTGAGLSNNYTVDSGPTPFFTDPEGINPDFRPPASAAAQVENLGSANNAPYADLGFDPKCIVRRDPQVPFQQSWWTYAIDYDYIRSIGGVARCFHPKERTAGVDIGAYELSGEPHAFSTPGSCVPSAPEPQPDPAPQPDPNPEPGPEPQPNPEQPAPADAGAPLAMGDAGQLPSDDPATPTVPVGPEPSPTATPGPSGTETPTDPSAPAPVPGAPAPEDTGVMNGIANPQPLAPPEAPSPQPNGTPMTGPSSTTPAPSTAASSSDKDSGGCSVTARAATHARPIGGLALLVLGWGAAFGLRRSRLERAHRRTSRPNAI